MDSEELQKFLKTKLYGSSIADRFKIHELAGCLWLDFEDGRTLKVYIQEVIPPTKTG